MVLFRFSIFLITLHLRRILVLNGHSMPAKYDIWDIRPQSSLSSQFQYHLLDRHSHLV